MKKDIYPDVRIEIISEGLTKKILESSGSPAPSVYGEEQPEGKNLPNVGIKGKNKELQSVLETSNKKPTYTGLVKEAIQELRKDAHDKEKPTAKINYGDTKNPEAFTRISDEFGSDDYQNPDKFISPTQVRENTGISPSATGTRTFGNQPLGEGIYGEGLGGRAEFKRRAQVADKKSGIESQVASQTQNMVKEAIQELRKDNHNKAPIFSGPVGQGDIDPTDPRALRDFETQTAAARDASKRSQAEFNVLGPSGYPTAFGAPIEGYAESSIGPEEKKLQSGGADGGYGSGVGPGYRPAEFYTPSALARDYKPPTPVSDYDAYNPTSVSSMSQAAGTGRLATSGEAFDREFEQGQRDKEEAAATKAEADKLRAASAKQTDDEPEEAPVVGPLTSRTDGDDGAIDEMAGNIKDNVMGTEGGDGPIEPPSGPIKPPSGAKTPEIDPKVTSELGLGVRANPELTRPKNSKGDLLPQFGSSGYFDAIVSIGEGGENVEANYGVSNLSDFLSLYAQNPQFDQTKFETNFKIEQKADIEKANPFKASLKKQAPPMAMTMNRPPNMGVGQQQPVVTGAGTMKNTEKAVAANKPAAAPAKTKARRRKPKTMEMMVKSITDAVMKQQESDVDTFSSSKQNYGDLSKPRTRMSDTGPDEYGDTNQFIPTPTKQFQPSKKTLSARPEVYRGE